MANNPVFVEYRESIDRWIVTIPSLKLELGPVFDHQITACEVGKKFEEGHPFFSEIPTVDQNSSFPRPNISKSRPYHRVSLKRFDI